jgi:hypothetical protein
MIKYKGAYPDSAERDNGNRFRLREEEGEKRFAQKKRGRPPVGPKIERTTSLDLQILKGLQIHLDHPKNVLVLCGRGGGRVCVRLDMYQEIKLQVLVGEAL